MQVTKYRLVYFFCPLSKKFIYSAFFSYCIQCFKFQVYIAETKCREHLLFLTYNLIYTMLREIKYNVYTLLKNLRFDSLNQKVYMTYNNK